MERDLRSRLIAEGDEVLESIGAYVVDVEVEHSRSRTMLRFFVDLEDGGISVADCSRAARLIMRHLEETNAFGGDYAMEASSPGIERRVARPRDFRRFVGREAKLKTRSRVGDKRNFSGVIEAADDSGVTLVSGEEKIHFPYDVVARAKLTYDFS